MGTKITTFAAFQAALSGDPSVYTEYYCSQCGRGARTNTPGVDKEGNIWCCWCLRGTQVMMQGRDQHTLQPNPSEPAYFFLDGATVWQEDGNLTLAWLEGGVLSVPIRDAERLLDPEVFLRIILEERDQHMYRCTGCRETFDNPPAGRPLFAGVNCDSCWEKHEKLLSWERRYGRVCSRCHQPYSACCC